VITQLEEKAGLAEAQLMRNEAMAEIANLAIRADSRRPGTLRITRTDIQDIMRVAYRDTERYGGVVHRRHFAMTIGIDFEAGTFNTSDVSSVVVRDSLRVAGQTGGPRRTTISLTPAGVRIQGEGDLADAERLPLLERTQLAGDLATWSTAEIMAKIQAPRPVSTVDISNITA
jgi:hypothetical protein